MIGGAKGIGIGLDFGIGSKSRINKSTSLDPAIKDALVGVWIADQNTNDSPTRNIIKNEISDRGGDFEILNAAYKLNSGHGKYNENFERWTTQAYVADSRYTSDHIHITKIYNGNAIIYTYNAANAMKVKVTGIKPNYDFRYAYAASDNTWSEIIIDKDGIYDLPSGVDGMESYHWNGFRVLSYIGECDITIEQIPEFKGAFVTDGVDDMIISQKPVSEMLEGSNELTVVSMIHQIKSWLNNFSTTNYIRNTQPNYIRNSLYNEGKTGIYGYTFKNIPIIINSILGDKTDYRVESNGDYNVENPKFSVEGYRNQNISITEVSQVAWYWTFIAKRVLTTDEINQIIAYYNLDKYVEPDVYYDVKKQGLTNENHTTFNNKLIDYSGKGRDLQLYNFGWNLDSGVGKYAEDFRDGSFVTYNNNVYRDRIITSSSISPDSNIIFAKSYNSKLPKLTIEIKGLKKDSWISIDYPINISTGLNDTLSIYKNGIYELLESYETSKDWFIVSLQGKQYAGLEIRLVPEYEGSLVADGIDNYGLADNLPLYNDYTIVVDRDWISVNHHSNLVFKGQANAFGAYAFEMKEPNDKTWSFNMANNIMCTSEKISYQTKYSYNRNNIVSGSSNDGNILYVFRSRDDYPYYANAAIRSLMTFPYSLSEFLIERQLKKRKLGTLYANMVEIRPIINSNKPYEDIEIYYQTGKLEPGLYLQTNSIINIYVKPKTNESISSVIFNGKEMKFIEIRGNGFYMYEGIITTSPQKINITIN